MKVAIVVEHFSLSYARWSRNPLKPEVSEVLFSRLEVWNGKNTCYYLNNWIKRKRKALESSTKQQVNSI